MKAALALALLLPCLALAAVPATGTRTWPIDPAQSLAQFSVRKFWFAHERGTFPDLRGSLRRFDTHVGVDLAEVEATLDVADLQMGDASDREHALGANFFDVARFPVIRFSSDPFPLGELSGGGTLHGLLTLHGERHPVAFALLPSDCPRQPLECVIRLRGTISRSLFGMRMWRGVLFDRVDLDLRIRLAPPAAED